MPDPPIIDAHIHFWDPQLLTYAWLASVPALRRPFRPEDIQPGSVRIDGLVFVEADCRPSESLAEVDWALSLSTPRRPVVGVVAGAFGTSSADVELAGLAGRPAVKGVRHLLQDKRPGWCRDPQFVGAVQSLTPYGLVFDLCVRHHQLAEATALAEQCPEVTFVLDHLGKPRVRPHPERGWLLDIERLAALPNTRCKLSGLTSEVLGPMGSGPAEGLFRPFLEHAVQSFGPARCLFGSDWPVASRTVTYEGWFDHVVSALHGLSAAEIGQVLGGTADEVYRLSDQPRHLSASTGRGDRLPTGPDPQAGGERAWH